MFGYKKIPPSDSICITFNGTIIHRVTSIKFLGVFVDEHSNWKKHILHVSSKISRSIGIMNRLCYVLPKSTLLTLYYSLIHPNLLYCVIVWGSACPTSLNRLVCLQKKAIRIATHSAFRSPSSPLFKSQHILKLCDLYKLQIALFMFKCLYELLPSCCIDFKPHLRPIQQQDTRSNCIKFNFYEPAYRTSIREHSISVFGPKLWNTIPPCIKEESCLNNFKKIMSHQFLFYY